MEKELFEKFLKNSCTEEELDKIIRLIRNDFSNDFWKKWAEEEWQKNQEIRFLDDNNFEGLLDKIHHKININEQLREEERKPAKKGFITYLTRAAAILLLPVLGFLFYTQFRNTSKTAEYAGLTSDSIEIVTPVGSRSQIQLADGTIVYLNYGSKLKYPQKFRSKTRNVVLTGEAYFKVAHNPQKPFVVNAGKLKIAALGTEFNVSAYSDEKIIQTTLVNGKVRIEKVGLNAEIDMDIMKPGQHHRYNQETGIVLNEFDDIEKYISWKDGKLIFKDESIVTITNKLGRWYNVDFEFQDRESMDFTYTATFIDENLNQILDLLKLATPIDYKILSRKKLADGTFSKQKVIIKKRQLNSN